MFGFHRASEPAHAPGLILAGLGNPERRYELTRHNAGFLFLSALSDRFGVPIKKKQFNALTGVWQVKDRVVLLMAPLTYMNLSGTALHAAMKEFGLVPRDIVVVHDDVDIATGKVKFSYDRSSAGHKGIESIVGKLGTRAFYRIRIGIGRPDNQEETADYVLAEFDEHELDVLRSEFDRIMDGLLMFIDGERQKAVESVNRITAA